MKFPKNPFQDKINALNSKDIDEGLKMEMLLRTPEVTKDAHDVNSAIFPRYNFPKVNTLSASELSMKDLIDGLQIQTILNNNIAPYVKKEIKSKVTAEMIKDFQYENAKPVEINGNLYKFRPPEVDIDLQEIPPEFPDLATYQAEMNARAEPIFLRIREIDEERQILDDRDDAYFNDYNYGHISREEYHSGLDRIEARRDQIEDEFSQLELARISLQKDYFGYDENRQEYIAYVEKIKAENKRALSNYEDELKSRNTGQSQPQREDETDEDYKDRLLITGRQIVDPETVEVQAQSYLYSTMKDRMSEMLQPYKVEAVLNQIIKVDGYEGLQVIKDRWPSLKKKLSDTFGDLRRVDSTDTIALFLLNETPENAKLVSPAPASRPAYDSPLASASRPAYDSPLASASRPAYDSRYDDSTTLVQRSIGPERPPPAYRFTGSMSNVAIPRNLFTPQVQPRVQPQAIVPYNPEPYEEVKLQRSERVAKRNRSENLIPLELMFGPQLKEILANSGYEFETGSSLKSKAANYETAVQAGLIPKRPTLLPRSQILQMNTPTLKSYLSSLPYVNGSRTGRPEDTNNRFALIKMYDRWASAESYGSGIKPNDLSGESQSDIKTRFAIIDGEIQAGNNAPQLIRDARKLLKEMVTQKMVTLYEAQTHLKHLRKMNKI